jgi:hypothetical protein
MIRLSPFDLPPHVLKKGGSQRGRYHSGQRQNLTQGAIDFTIMGIEVICFQYYLCRALIIPPVE